MKCKKKTFLFVSVYIYILVFIVYELYSGITKKNLSQKKESLENSKGKNKLILFWTRSWSAREYPIAGWDIDENTLKDCEYQCEFTDDQSRIGETDALIYHAVFWNKWESIKEYLANQLPQRNEKYRNQIWTFFRVEPPTTNFVRDFRNFDNVFNWTATYRLDSDVPYLYGIFEKRNDDDFQTTESLKNKSMFGWMDSHTNCRTPSRREDVMAELKKYVHVDVYGDCGELGPFKCSGKNFCYADLGSKYKFWAVFENSNCLNYLSEKFYLAIEYGMVPVVYAHPTFKQLVPENSYIDIASFESIKELAKHLKYLDETPQEYLKYFEWRKTLQLQVHSNLDSNYWCTFCTKLSTNYDENGKLKRKSYESIHDWWYSNNSAYSVCNHEIVSSSLVPNSILLLILVLLMVMLIFYLYSITHRRYRFTRRI